MSLPLLSLVRYDLTLHRNYSSAKPKRVVKKKDVYNSSEEDSSDPSSSESDNDDLDGEKVVKKAKDAKKAPPPKSSRAGLRNSKVKNITGPLTPVKMAPRGATKGLAAPRPLQLNGAAEVSDLSADEEDGEGGEAMEED